MKKITLLLITAIALFSCSKEIVYPVKPDNFEMNVQLFVTNYFASSNKNVMTYKPSDLLKDGAKNEFKMYVTVLTNSSSYFVELTFDRSYQMKSIIVNQLLKVS